MLASCDDKGSTPSGGSGITILAELPDNNYYPASGWDVSLQPTDPSAKAVSAGSVSYTAAAKDDPAFLTISGIPAGSYSTMAVSYTSTAGRSYEAKSVSLTGAGVGTTISIPSSSISFSDVTPQTLSLTITNPSLSEGQSMPKEASAYTVYMTPETPPASPSAPAAIEATTANVGSTTTVITFPASSLKANSSSATSYKASVAVAIGEAIYSGNAATAIAVQLGQSNPASPAAFALSEVKAGSITVTIPDKITVGAGQADVAATDTASYVLYNDANKAILASAENAALTAGSNNFTFAISVPAAAIAQASSASATYKLNVTISSETTSYLAAAQEVTGFPASAGSASPSTFVEQVSSLSVTMVNAGTSLEALPTDAAYYNVSLYEGETAEGTPLKAIDLSDSACSWNALKGTFTVSGLEVGKAYTVKAVITPASGSAVTLVGTVDGTVAGENSLNLTSADVTILTFSNSISATTGSVTGGSTTLTKANTDNSAVADANIKISVSGSNTATVSGSIVLNVTGSAYENLALNTTGLTFGEGSITGLTGSSSITVNSIKFTTASASSTEITGMEISAT